MEIRSTERGKKLKVKAMCQLLGSWAFISSYGNNYGNAAAPQDEQRTLDRVRQHFRVPAQQSELQSVVLDPNNVVVTLIHRISSRVIQWANLHNPI